MALDVESIFLWTKNETESEYVNNRFEVVSMPSFNRYWQHLQNHWDKDLSVPYWTYESVDIFWQQG